MTNRRLLIFAILCFALTLRAASFFLPHIENDEVIYQTLAEKLTNKPLDYSLQETELLKKLPASQYDHPIFRHPPLFFYLLALIYKLLGLQWGMLLPVINGTLCIYVGYLIAARLSGEKEALLAAIIMASCPILLLTSSRLWIDTTSTLSMLLGFYFFILGFDEDSPLTLILSAIAVSAAILSKYAALGILPACMLRSCYSAKPLGHIVRRNALFLCVIGACVLPWLIWYRTVMGGFSYTAHFSPTQEYLDMFPFVKRSYRQPFYVYFSQLALSAPVYIFALFSLKKSLRTKENLVLWLWVATFIIAFTVLLKMAIIGYALRYLLPISIPLSILAARALAHAKTAVLVTAVLLLASQILTGLLNGFIFYAADVFPLAYYVKHVF